MWYSEMSIYNLMVILGDFLFGNNQACVFILIKTSTHDHMFAQ